VRLRRAGIAAVASVLLALLLWSLTPTAAPEPLVDPRVAPLLKAVEEPVEAPAAPGDIASYEPMVWREVVCPLTVEIRGRESDLRVVMFDGRGAGELTSVAAELRRENIRFSAPTADGAGLVKLYGYEQAPLIWWTEDDGLVACTFSRDPAPKELVTVRMTVELPEGATFDEIRVMACGSHLMGGWEEVREARFEPGQCEITACRRRKFLSACNDPIILDLTLGDPVELALQVPDYAPAGLDVTLMFHDDGVEIGAVQVGSTADTAGLEVGDVILAIDGASAAEMDYGQRRTALVGPRGSPVQLEVRGADGKHFDVEVERDFID